VTSTGAVSRSKAVNSVQKPASTTGIYCFDLAFTPALAVGSAFANNAAFVSTSISNENGAAFTGCDTDHLDAVVITRGSNAANADVGFSVLFE
jgi:hypothetical protein